jgi:hypothetical protein
LQGKFPPVVIRLKNCYNLWQIFLRDFPKANRYTLGSKIDEVFLFSIEYTFLASYTNFKYKIIIIDKAISRIDLLKLLILLSWEIKALENNKYIEISEKLEEVGRMLGGWKKQIQEKTSQIDEKKKIL